MGKQIEAVTELKACPFCGATATAYIAFPQSEYPWMVDVDHVEPCPMRTTDSYCYADKADLLTAWNMRPLSGDPS